MVGGTEAMILAVLARRPSSGYDLRGWFERTGVYLGWRSSLSPIYRTLAGWKPTVSSCRNGGRPNAPAAKVYRLTPQGREAILDWARSPHVPSQRPMDPDFGVRFMLAGQFGREIALDVLRQELAYRLKQKEEQGPPEPVRTNLNPIPELDPEWAAELDRLAHERGYASTAAYIAWLELTIARLEGD